MAARVKVKKVNLIKNTSEDPDIADIFKDMMNGSIKIDIVHRKYKLIYETACRYKNLINILIPQCANDQYIKKFYREICDSITREFNAEDLDKYFTNPLAAPKDVYDSISAANKARYIDTYKRVKVCNYVNSIVITLNNINSKKLNFMDEVKLPGGKFSYVPKQGKLPSAYITKYAGNEWCPISGAEALNIKQIYIMSQTQDDKDFLLMWIQKLYEICYKMYETLNIPDIDPDDFIKIVKVSIEKLKKQIPRCGKAFKKIEESISMLKDNFTNYYKDYITSNNPSIIIESFISDVSKESGNDIELAREFRSIINYYKKMVKQQKETGNSKLNKVFSHVESQFSLLSNITGQKLDDEEEDDDEIVQENENEEITQENEDKNEEKNEENTNTNENEDDKPLDMANLQSELMGMFGNINTLDENLEPETTE